MVDGSDVPEGWIPASTLDADVLAARCPSAVPRNVEATSVAAFAAGESPPPAVYALAVAFPSRQAAYEAYDHVLVPALECVAGALVDHANDAEASKIEADDGVLGEGLPPFGSASTVRGYSASVAAEGDQQVAVEVGYAQNVVLLVAVVSRADAPIASADVRRMFAPLDRRLSEVGSPSP